MSSTTVQVGLASKIETVPVEIRDMIFGHILDNESVTTLVGQNVVGPKFGVTAFKNNYCVDLFRVSNQFGSEAADYFYAKNTFVVVSCTRLFLDTTIKDCRLVFPVTTCTGSNVQLCEKHGLKIELGCREGPFAQQLTEVVVFAGCHLQDFVKLLNCMEWNHRIFWFDGYKLKLSFGESLTLAAKSLLIAGLKGVSGFQSKIISIDGSLDNKQKSTIRKDAANGRLCARISIPVLECILDRTENAIKVGNRALAFGQMNLALAVVKFVYQGADREARKGCMNAKQAELALEMGLVAEAIEYSKAILDRAPMNGRALVLLGRAYVAKLEFTGVDTIVYHAAQKSFNRAKEAWPENDEIPRLLEGAKAVIVAKFKADQEEWKLRNPHLRLS